MTIALGILTPSVLLVAADSQESWNGPMRAANKVQIGILGGRETRGRIVVTGAGGSGFLAYLKGRIIERCEEELDYSGSTGLLAQIEAVITSEMVDFFEKHWSPFAHLDDWRLQGQPALIVAVHVGEERALWCTESTAVRRIPAGPTVVGSGKLWAQDALDVDYSFLLGEHAATVAACHAIFAAKEHNEWCGKDTHVFLLREHGKPMDFANPDAVRAAEAVFRQYQELQNDTLRAMLAPPRLNARTSADRRLTAMRRKLAAIEFY